MDYKEKTIECCEHGEQQATFVCQHIVQSIIDKNPRGFWSAEDPENLRPDSWCSECEAKVQESNGEWNDASEAFADVKLMCGSCYDRAKEINFISHKYWWQFWK